MLKYLTPKYKKKKNRFRNMVDYTNEYKDIIRRIESIYVFIKTKDTVALPLFVKAVVEFSKTEYKIPELNNIKKMIFDEPLTEDKTEYLDKVILFMGRLKFISPRLSDNDYKFIEVFDFLRSFENAFIAKNDKNQTTDRTNGDYRKRCKSPLTLNICSDVLRGTLWDLNCFRLMERLKHPSYTSSCVTPMNRTTKEDLYLLEETENCSQKKSNRILKYTNDKYKKENMFVKDLTTPVNVEDYLKNNIENLIKTSLLMEEYLSIFTTKHTLQRFYFKFMPIK